MKRLFIILSIMLSLFVIVSCKPETERANLRIELKNTRRTIAPEKENLEIYGYKIIAVSPSGNESEPYYTYYSYLNLDGLSVGKWKIKVYGFNFEKQDIAYGEGEIGLISGKNNISISLDTLLGNGDLSLTLDWSDSGLEDVKTIHTVFKSHSGKEIILAPSTPVNSKSSITYTNLPSGSYTLQVELRDSEGKKLQGLLEAIRISNGEVTKGTITFLSKVEESSAEIIISDETSLPVEVNITGVESLVEADTAFTVAVSISDNSVVKEKDLNVVWYLDGIEVGHGINFTFPNGVSEGMHRIDVTSSTGEEGSIGSKSISFQAAISTKNGDPYQKITLTSGSKFIIGKEAVLHFLPNNYLLVASNQYKTVQLISILQNTASVQAEYRYDELNIGGYSVADFASSGAESDPYYSVIVLCNSSSSCKAVNLIVSKTQITYSDEAKDFDKATGANRACRFVNIVKGNNVLISTIENIGKTRMGYIVFNIRPDAGKMINREEYVTNPAIDFGYSGFKAMASLPDKGYVVAISGQRGKVNESLYRLDMSLASFTEYHLWVNWSDFLKYYNQGLTKDEYQSAYSCGFLSNDGRYVFVLSREGIYYYKLADNISNEYEQYHFEELTSGKIGTIKMCQDVRFGYMIDNENKKLITLTPGIEDDVYHLIRGSSISLDTTTNDTLDISPDGKYLVVYNSLEGNSATVIKASR